MPILRASDALNRSQLPTMHEGKLPRAHCDRINHHLRNGACRTNTVGCDAPKTQSTAQVVAHRLHDERGDGIGVFTLCRAIDFVGAHNRLCSCRRCSRFSDAGGNRSKRKTPSPTIKSLDIRDRHRLSTSFATDSRTYRRSLWSSCDHRHFSSPLSFSSRRIRNWRCSTFTLTGRNHGLVRNFRDCRFLDGNRDFRGHRQFVCDTYAQNKTNARNSLWALHGDWFTNISNLERALMAQTPSIRSLQDGNADAWRWFFDEFSGPVAGYARRMGVSDPDDVTSAVLEAVARSVGSFSGSHRQFRSWVFSIAHARIVDDFRKQSRRDEVDLDSATLPSAASAESSVVSGDPELEWAMSQLSDDQRAMLHLRYVIGLSTKDVAKSLGKSEVATRVALHRSSTRLKELLEGESFSEEVSS